MAVAMSNLHFGDTFIHEIFASYMKRVRKVVDFLIGK